MIIATVGSATANSYVTLQEAELYFENRIHSSDWSDITVDETKEALLITATNMLDWYASWKGTKTETTQALQWPREDAVRGDGTEIDDGVIPTEVKQAVYELALSSVNDDRTADSALAGLEKVKVSTLEIQGSIGENDAATIPEKIWRILSDLTVNSSTKVIRLVRA